MPLESVSRGAWEDRFAAMADREFADHVINQDPYRLWPTGFPNGHFYVQKPGTGIYDFEVAVLTRSRLLVHGDIPTVIFQPSGRLTGRDRIRFVAGIQASNLNYLSEKVVTPERYAWDAQVAIYDMERWIDECDPTDDTDTKTCDQMRAIVQRVRRGNIDNEMELREVLHESSLDDAWEYTFGRVTNPDIIYAWRAVVKLDQLLGSL